MINKTNDFYFILSAHAPVRIKGTMSAYVIWKLANKSEGIVDATSAKQLLESIPSRNAYWTGSPMSPLIERPKVRVKPTVYHKRERIHEPERICTSSETTFLILIMPD